MSENIEIPAIPELIVQSELVIPPSKVLGLVGIVVVGNLATYMSIAALKVYAARKQAVQDANAPEAEMKKAEEPAKKASPRKKVAPKATS